MRRTPALALSPLVSTPTVLGALRPAILWPANLPADDRDATACLVHELAHVRRQDVAWLMLSRLVQALWWWHPLAWLASRELRETAEQACDHWAIALGADRREYADSLVNCAQTAVGGAGLACGARGRALKRRVRRILHSHGLPPLHVSPWGRTSVLGGAVVAILAVSGISVRAAPSTSPNPARDVATAAHRDTWGPLPATAVAKLKLEFYFALGEPDPRQPMPDVPVGHKLLLFPRTGLYYVVAAEPDLTMADVERIDWSPSFQRLHPNGARSGGPQLVIRFRDIEGFKQLAAQHLHGAFVVGVGDQAFAVSTNQAPSLGGTYVRVSPDIGNACVWFCDLPAEQQIVILPYVKGWPTSEGLFIPESTGAQPFPTLANTARVTVAASFVDRTVPTGAVCVFTPWEDTARPVPYPPAVPTVTGNNGDWVSHNVAPGDWMVTLTGADFVQGNAVVHVAQGETDKRLDLLLSRGGTVTGRVVRAGTVQPLAGVSVVAFLGRDPRGVHTDQQGRYVLEHVAPGPVRVEVRAPGSDLVSVVLDLGTLVEGGTLEAVEARLAPGGYIAGRIVPPPDLRRDLRWMGSVQPYGQDGVSAEPPVIAGVHEDLTFRVGPLAAGTYRLSVQLHSYDDTRLRLHGWQGEVADLRVEVGKELRDVAITLTEPPE